MKTLILAASLFLSLHAFADQVTDFQHKANCQGYGRRYDSKITNVTKISEDNDSAVFRLNFVYGLCDSIDQVQGPIKIQKRMVQISDYGLAHPFSKTKASVVSFKALSETEMEAEISVKKNATSKKFILDIWAGDWIGFPWVMSFKDEAGNLEVSFEGFERL